MTPENGKDELFLEMISQCKRVANDLSTVVGDDSADMESIHKQVGGLVCMVDFLMEHGILLPKKIQNNKLMKRISFNENRQFLMERVRVIPNFDPPPSIWEQ